MAFFTVAPSEGMNREFEFEAYVRLLEDWGVDISNIPRTLEPGTQNRWLYVWDNRPDAERFAGELQKRTRENGWYVRQLREDPQQRGPLAPLEIDVGVQSDGYSCSLHPNSRALIKRRYPQSRLVNSVFIGYETKNDFEQFHGPVWDHVANLLTGLDTLKINELGGFRVYDPASQRTVWESKQAANA